MAEYTITSEQLHALEDMFQCLIEVEENDSLRVVYGDSVSIIAPDGDIAKYPASQFGEYDT
jgi:hypothetical protein